MTDDEFCWCSTLSNALADAFLDEWISARYQVYDVLSWREWQDEYRRFLIAELQGSPEAIQAVFERTINRYDTSGDC